jgi:hypothetical protein
VTTAIAVVIVAIETRAIALSLRIVAPGCDGIRKSVRPSLLWMDGRVKPVNDER